LFFTAPLLAREQQRIYLRSSASGGRPDHHSGYNRWESVSRWPTSLSRAR
jgi:hypothetical protein